MEEKICSIILLLPNRKEFNKKQQIDKKTRKKSIE